jgi:predicted aconitase
VEGAVTLRLSDLDRRMSDGRDGEAAQLAMGFIVRAAEATGATQLLDISGAHLIGGFYMGQVGLDFARRLVELGARVRVPTTLTASSIALAQPDLAPAAPHETDQRELAALYEQLGAEPAWTCAPYHLPNRPTFGQQIAWGESGAVAFANTVLGARTNNYGEPLDVAAAICGRVPASRLHLTEERAARIVFDVGGLDPTLFAENAVYQALGYLIGSVAQTRIPAIVGLPASVTEDQFVALVASAASSGGVELLHAVGVTPEAPTLEAALQGRPPERDVTVGAARLRQASAALSTARRDECLGAVCVGTPHLSLHEIEQLVTLLDGRRVAFSVPFYASTCRFIAQEARRRGHLERLDAAGVTLVLDRCTYYGNLIQPGGGAIMTCSAKWAHYGPAILGARVIFGSMRECVESAIAGSVWTDEALWSADRWS